MAREKWKLNLEDKRNLKEELREKYPELTVTWNSYGRLRITETAKQGDHKRTDYMARMLAIVREEGFSAAISTARFVPGTFAGETWGTWIVTLNLWKGQLHERS